MEGRRFRWCIAVAVGCGLAGYPHGESFAQSGETRARAPVNLRVKQTDDLRAAWNEQGRPTDVCNLGKAELALGRARDAAESLSTCLRVLPQKEKELIGKVIEYDLRTARALVGELKIVAGARELPWPWRPAGVP